MRLPPSVVIHVVSIGDAAALAALFERHSPKTVFHAASLIDLRPMDRWTKEGRLLEEINVEAVTCLLAAQMEALIER